VIRPHLEAEERAMKGGAAVVKVSVGGGSTRLAHDVAERGGYGGPGRPNAGGGGRVEEYLHIHQTMRATPTPSPTKVGGWRDVRSSAPCTDCTVVRATLVHTQPDQPSNKGEVEPAGSESRYAIGREEARVEHATTVLQLCTGGSNRVCHPTKRRWVGDCTSPKDSDEFNPATGDVLNNSELIVGRQ
jgi:hypothetical protein